MQQGRWLTSCWNVSAMCLPPILKSFIWVEFGEWCTYHDIMPHIGPSFPHGWFLIRWGFYRSPAFSVTILCPNLRISFEKIFLLKLVTKIYGWILSCDPPLLWSLSLACSADPNWLSFHSSLPNSILSIPTCRTADLICGLALLYGVRGW